MQLEVHSVRASASPSTIDQLVLTASVSACTALVAQDPHQPAQDAHFVGTATLDLDWALTLHALHAVPRCATRSATALGQRWRRGCHCPHPGRTPRLQPETLQHASVDAVGGPVDLPPHHTLAVGPLLALHIPFLLLRTRRVAPFHWQNGKGQP